MDLRERVGKLSIQDLKRVHRQLTQSSGRRPANAMEPQPRPDRLPLSYAQEQLWFVAQLEDAGAAYHLAGGVRLTGLLDAAALRAALDTIVQRHEVLRTVFVNEAGSPVQQVRPAQAFSLIEADLSAIPAPEREQALGELAIAEANETFDLSVGPLIRGRLLRLQEEEHVLLVTMHHIVSDGWSLGILMKELTALYGAYREGRGNPLPLLPVQYADYVLWQRRLLAEP